MLRISRPVEGEYAPYTQEYLDLVPTGVEVLAHLPDGVATTRSMLAGVSDDLLVRRWEPGEWNH
jgi:hypothetical protein